MSIRIEIELTSSSPDGSWTWRAAGAREPRGVLDGSILPPGAAVGDTFRVETEKDLDGIRVLAVVPPKEKAQRVSLLELLPTEETFEPVVQHRAPGGARRPRRDRGEGEGRRDRRERRGDRPERSERRGPRAGGEERRRPRPHFTPPPEVPQRPKPKRLRPGKQHRNAVLASTPEEQRPIAELALQGMAAVRQRLREENRRLRDEGKPEMPESAVLKLAEEMLPRLRVADWLDRAEAAKRQLEHLDLRDLRSVVAASDDPLVARDESTRELAAELKTALATKQEEELQLWLSDVEAALDVGRVVRALRLSAMPPKAGVPFPPALAVRLADATNAAMQPADAPDRWIALLEAAAFSPVRSMIAPAAPAEQRSDELLATVKRLGPLLPAVAAIFGVDVPADAPIPKPLRPTGRRDAPKKQAPRKDAPRGAGRGSEPKAADAAQGAEQADRAEDAEPSADAPAPAEPAAPAAEAPAQDAAAVADEPAGDGTRPAEEAVEAASDEAAPASDEG
jgi:hypothetical protein